MPILMVLPSHCLRRRSTGGKGDSIGGFGGQQLQILCWNDGMGIWPFAAGHSAGPMVSAAYIPCITSWLPVLVPVRAGLCTHLQSSGCMRSAAETLLPMLQVHSCVLALSCAQAVLAAPSPALEGGAHPDGRLVCCSRPSEVYVKL